MKKRLDPIHPGEILADELTEIGMTASELATRIHVPKNRLYAIVNGERALTADTAMRLGAFFGTGPNLWMNLQNNYELDIAEQVMGDELKTIEPYQILESG
jgi:hypothetical protein